MYMLTKRVQILFDEQLWRKLSALAKKENASLGKLTRTALEGTYFQGDDRAAIRETVESIKQIRKRVKGKIDYKALINYGRKY